MVHLLAFLEFDRPFRFLILINAATLKSFELPVIKG